MEGRKGVGPRPRGRLKPSLKSRHPRAPPGFETVTRVVSVESATEPMVLVRLRPAATPGTTENAPTPPTPPASTATPQAAAVPPETAPARQKGGSNTALIILGSAAAVGGGV